MKNDIEARRHWMAVLARSRSDDVNSIWQDLGANPEFDFLADPEFASVMLRAQAGADGRVFNLGEVVVTTCSVRLRGEAVGTACIIGRNKRHATIAALIDAALVDRETPQLPAFHAAIAELDLRLKRRIGQTAQKTRQTKVDFMMAVAG